MKRAFSLVELSIVLVILGLLTGGILAGQSLIRAAELRSLTSDVMKYRIAALTFRDKYLANAGDMPNATRFWNIAAGATGNDNTCYDTASTDTRTCNGNGDGAIGVYGFTPYESFRFWQHLANAGLIEGSYSGRASSGNGATQLGCIPGTSCPAMRVRNTSILPVHQYSAGDADFIPYPQDNYYILGNTTVNGVVNNNPLGPVTTTEEAWNIDTKIDDGLPYQGFFQTFYRAGATQWAATELNACANSATVAGATYNFTRTGPSCAFRIRFN